MKYFPIPLVFTLIPTILTSLVAGKWSIGGLVDPPWTCDPKESTIMLMCIERARTWSLLFCPFMLFWSAHAMIDETATYCRARVRAVQPHVDLDELPCPRQSAERHRSLVMPGQRPLHPAGVRQRRKRGSCRCRARAMCGLRCQHFGGSSFLHAAAPSSRGWESCRGVKRSSQMVWSQDGRLQSAPARVLYAGSACLLGWCTDSVSPEDANFAHNLALRSCARPTCLSGWCTKAVLPSRRKKAARGGH